MRGATDPGIPFTDNSRYFTLEGRWAGGGGAWEQSDKVTSSWHHHTGHNVAKRGHSDASWTLMTICCVVFMILEHSVMNKVWQKHFSGRTEKIPTGPVTKKSAVDPRTESENWEWNPCEQLNSTCCQYLHHTVFPTESQCHSHSDSCLQTWP